MRATGFYSRLKYRCKERCWVGWSNGIRWWWCGKISFGCLQSGNWRTL